MSASAKCPHADLHVHVNIARMGDSNVGYAELTMHCKACELPMTFRGLPLGLSPQQPTGSLGGHEARLPFIPEGEQPTGPTGGLVGFSIKGGD